MRVAVVGAGIAGLTAAYRLSRGGHHVELFERDRRAGGHARTVIVAEGDLDIPVDTGFIVYNETTYPGFTSLLRELGVPTRASDMSFSSSCAACRFEFSSRGLRGFLAQPTNVLRAGHWRFLLDLRRFHADARKLLEAGGSSPLTLDDYLQSGRFGRTFARHFLVPIAASVWSTPPAAIGTFPLAHLMRFLDNHGMIGFNRTLQWRTIEGGSRVYVEPILYALPEGSTHLSADVRTIRRGPAGVCLVVDGVEVGPFDRVVLACHADDALRLLADADEDERAALGGFRYTRNRVVLHSDASVLPRRLPARASWNHAVADCRRPNSDLTLTYDLTRLQGLRGERRYLASVNPAAGAIDPRAVLDAVEFRHPAYTFETLDAQQRLQAINGRRGTYFAGAHLGYGFHEDGYASGVRAAEAIEASAVAGAAVGVV
jgi:predicted NAD/FAD-binding protein